MSRSEEPRRGPVEGEERVLLLAPVGEDAEVLRRVLIGDGIVAVEYESPEALARAIAEEDPAAVLLAEEALETANGAGLVRALEAQPTWSDLPIIVLVSGAEGDPDGRRLAGELLEAGCACLVERPIHAPILRSALRSAIKARRRQWEAREHLEELRRRESELHESRERLDFILEAAEVGAWDWDVREGHVHCSPNLARIHRLPDDGSSMTMDAFLETVHPEDGEEFRKAISDALEGGREFRVEYRLAGGDRDPRWIESRGRVVHDDEGRAVWMAGLCMDVTHRKQSEVRRSRLAAIVESSSDAIITKGFDGTIESWNHGAERTFGYSAEEAVGRSIDIVVPQERRDEGRRIRSIVAGGGSVRALETERVRKDGARIRVELTLSPVIGPDRRPLRIAAIERDVTERRRAEEEIRALNETLEQRVVERTRVVKLLEEVAAIANEAVSLERAVGAILQKTCRGLGWHLGQAYVLESGRESNYVPSGIWWSTDPRRHAERLRDLASRRFHPGQGMVGRAALTGRPVFVPDVGADDFFLREPGPLAGGRARIRSALAVPVLCEGEVPAVLEFLAEDAREVDESLLEALASVGTHLGRVYERKRWEEELSEVVWEVQRRAGREIHAGLGQQLTGLGMIARALQRRLREGQGREADEARRLAEGLEEAACQVHNLLKGLLPVEVDAAGLMGALDDLARRCREGYGTPCTFHCDQPVLVENNAIATHLFRIAQEAVLSALDQGGASRVEVRLELVTGNVRLEVGHDGEPVGDGLGFRLMRHRAGLIGARLRTERTPTGWNLTICDVSLEGRGRMPEGQMGSPPMAGGPAS